MKKIKKEIQDFLTGTHDSRFKTIVDSKSTPSSYIIVDKETGVNYLFSYVGYAGGLTLLVDKDGKPIVTPV